MTVKTRSFLRFRYLLMMDNVKTPLRTDSYRNRRDYIMAIRAPIRTSALVCRK